MSRNQVRAVKVMASEKILLVTKKDEKGRRIGRKKVKGEGRDAPLERQTGLG